MSDEIPKTDRQVLETVSGIMAIEFDGIPDAETARQVADAVGRKLAMKGVPDERRQEVEARLTEMLGRGPEGVTELVLGQTVRLLERAMDALEHIPECMVGIAKLQKEGASVFNFGGIAAVSEACQTSLHALRATIKERLEEETENAEDPS